MIEINCTEEDLENFLCTNNNLKKYLGLRFLKRQFRTPVGIVDIIAYNQNTKRFVLIELKKDLLDYKAFFQIERYALYFKKKEYERWENKHVNRHFLERGDITFTKLAIPREFDCLLIGKDLSADLHHSVEHWEDDSSLVYARMWYTCFGYKFDEPISFDWFSPAQIEIENNHYNENENV